LVDIVSHLVGQIPQKPPQMALIGIFKPYRYFPYLE